MKLDPHQKHGLKRGPMRTLAELGEELGVPAARLRGLLGRRPDGPTPYKVGHGSRTTGPKTYYNRAEFHRWYRAIAQP